ncbi:hypothetical protein LOTGIDRAFT_234075 [Lottia gigantea]|uniref:Uncharacterized protein n=1 Tax=Lottia gigantea TaxID=225164 RepID=V4BM61_LOTGI|nr:hypothetical protein LOTGIDRAFT_234075 [Lottia gigantea]ESO89969.1 hypothetical protein LOTGIDRAFT_234075 [Lottia gigantea]
MSFVNLRRGKNSTGPVNHSGGEAMRDTNGTLYSCSPEGILVYIVAIIAKVKTQVNGGTGGTGTGAQQPTPCMDQFNANFAQRCFETQNVSFQGALNLLTQGQRGELPAGITQEEFKRRLCGDATLDFIIPCALQLSSYYMNQTSCSEQERQFIVGTARTFSAALTPLCLAECEIQTNQRAMQCFASAQIDPNRAMNTSMLSDKFIILGNTSVDIQRFCSNHGTLFTCLEAEKARCPAFEKRMYEEGVDFTAMKLATAVLCQNQQVYMAALQCFSSNQQVLQPCQTSVGRPVEELLIGRLSLGTVAPSQMVGRLCTLRFKNLLPCHLNAYNSVCAANLMQLRTAFECNMIAAPCKQEAGIQQDITQMCQASPPPHQTITQKPPVVVKPPDTQVNTFANNPTNVQNGNTIPAGTGNVMSNNNPNMNNNNNFNNGNNGNGGAALSVTFLVTLFVICSAFYLY